MVPVCPLKVNPVEFVPVQTVALPAMDPPTDAGETVTKILVAKSVHPPEVTVLLK